MSDVEQDLLQAIELSKQQEVKEQKRILRDIQSGILELPSSGIVIVGDCCLST